MGCAAQSMAGSCPGERRLLEVRFPVVVHARSPVTHSRVSLEARVIIPDRQASNKPAWWQVRIRKAVRFASLGTMQDEFAELAGGSSHRGSVLLEAILALTLLAMLAVPTLAGWTAAERSLRLALDRQALVESAEEGLAILSGLSTSRLVERLEAGRGEWVVEQVSERSKGPWRIGSLDRQAAGYFRRTTVRAIRLDRGEVVDSSQDDSSDWQGVSLSMMMGRIDARRPLKQLELRCLRAI